MSQDGEDGRRNQESVGRCERDAHAANAFAKAAPTRDDNGHGDEQQA